MARRSRTSARHLKNAQKDRSPQTVATSPDAWWDHHHGQWRSPHQIITQWQSAESVDRDLLRHQTSGDWWNVLASTGMTLLVTREYEHLVMAVSASEGAPLVSYLSMPHPSGMAFNRQTEKLFIASTRNPNQIYRLAAADVDDSRLDIKIEQRDFRAIMPSGSTFFPGCLYIHDLAFIGGDLHANAVGQNAVIKITGDSYKRVWWPACVEQDGVPSFGKNHIQLNSIAGGRTLEDSYFTASCDEITNRSPGQKNFPVDGRGVIFHGLTRQPIARGLTRPHSARLHKGAVWVDNSGYGQVGCVRDGRLTVVQTLPGWTRGLAFSKDIAFVGTSRVIPRFSCYAPGLDADRSVCALHAIDIRTGKLLGSMRWPSGNQIFSIELIPSQVSQGFPFVVGKRSQERESVVLQFCQHVKREKRMTSDFKLLMLGAMYENGGNTTHRFLDGHPQMFVYPFESQIGTRHVQDNLTSLFPVKYRWPSFLLDSTPVDDYRAIIDEEGKVRARTPHVSKFRHMEFDFSDDDRLNRFTQYVSTYERRSRAKNVEAFFRATFDAWKNFNRSGKETLYVGYSPIITVDADKILEDLPQAHVLHVVRNPWSAYADTKKRPVPMSLKDYLFGWTTNQYFALLNKEKFPDRMHILRLEDILSNPAQTLGDLCEELGLKRSNTLATPTWNGTALDTVYPWGTIKKATPEANKATADELSAAEKNEIKQRAWQYLDAFDYASFLSIKAAAR